MLPTFNILIASSHAITAQAYKQTLVSNKQQFPIPLNINLVYSIETIFDKLKMKDLLGDNGLIILDTDFYFSYEEKVKSAEQLCEAIKNKINNAKLLITTSFKDNLRLINILNIVNPEGLIIKSDITDFHLLTAVTNIFSGESYFSKTVINLLKKKICQNIVIDAIDTNILIELSNGAKMVELLKFIPLTKSGIEKRKRRLKQLFETKNNSDRELVMVAKAKGFI
ncbi:hypothetical protein PW52_08710 [Tamlana sedimentorum]|uniref:Uncharacterized protein n=1 Tax=Neotamlana sedimentorum TaxID=1435349 RepID=A0A0D7W9I1_9FLAO|nr:hypothetical protein [Tamlana sedimentorum]KJD35805.1 hypothetical protein PW52_08710 [Tamlana sedimentorum]